MEIISSGLTDVGMKREGNEDSWASLDEEGLYLVADGMGGHAAGEIASGTAVSIISNFIKNSLASAKAPRKNEAVTDEQAPDEEKTVTDEQSFAEEETVTEEQSFTEDKIVTGDERLDEEETITDEQSLAEEETIIEGKTELGIDYYLGLLEKGVLEANEAICRLSKENSNYSGMGTTLSGILVRNGQAAIAHVGDSRIYLLRDGELRAVTTDHSWVNEQLQRNIITAEEAKTHRWRNVITRALGNTPDLEVDTMKIDLQPGDCFILCSDGLTGMVEEPDMAGVVSEMKDDLDGACRNLVELAKAAGGDDNITVVILRAVE